MLLQQVQETGATALACNPTGLGTSDGCVWLCTEVGVSDGVCALFVAAQDIQLGRLLLAIHEFFSALGPEEIRRRGAKEDKPLRMVKTILHEVRQ